MNEANDTYRYDAFISYSHHDKDWVDGWLLPRLEAAGLRICIDFRDFEPGLSSLINMENAVERSRKTLIVLTPAWVKSQWTTFESLLIQTDDPAGRQRRMIPLLLKPCEPPKRIGILTHVNLTQPAEAEFQLQRLVAAITDEPMPDVPRPVALYLGGKQVKPTAPRSTTVDKRALRKAMVQAFSLEELDTICADVEQLLADDGIKLQVNLEIVGGSSKAGKVLNLIGYLDRREYLAPLVTALRRERPGII